MSQLMNDLRAAMRSTHYAYRTEKTYLHWIHRYILFHGKRHPSELGAKEIAVFLTHLANAEHVSASTQNVALQTILYLYKFPEKDLGSEFRPRQERQTHPHGAFHR